jgi:hypothetical protein
VPRMLALRAGIELKKGEILKAKKNAFLDQIDSCGAGLNSALSTLTLHMGIIDDSYLPFKDLVALIGATYASDWAQIKDRAIAFLWTICLVEDWDSSTNDKTRAAFRQLRDLIDGKLPGERIVERLEQGFPPFEDVRDSTSKASIVYRTLMASNLSRRGIDWAGIGRFPGETMQDHHLFPRDWLGNNRDPSEDKQLWASLRDSVLNRIFVSKQANNKAKALVPPNYLNELTADERRVLQVPDSFLGPLEAPIKSDAFAAYLRDRYDLIKADLVDHVRRSMMQTRVS